MYSSSRGPGVPEGGLVPVVGSGLVQGEGGVISQHALRQTPPCEQNDR